MQLDMTPFCHLLGLNSDKRHGIETATLDSRNGHKWHKDGLNPGQQQREGQIQ